MGEKYSPCPYGLKIDRNTIGFKAFSAKRSFTPEEFACLLADVDPTSFDGTAKSWDVFETKVRPFVRLIEKEITEQKKVYDYDDLPF